MIDNWVAAVFSIMRAVMLCTASVANDAGRPVFLLASLGLTFGAGLLGWSVLTP